MKEAKLMVDESRPQEIAAIGPVYLVAPDPDRPGRWQVTALTAATIADMELVPPSRIFSAHSGEATDAARQRAEQYAQVMNMIAARDNTRIPPIMSNPEPPAAPPKRRRPRAPKVVQPTTSPPRPKAPRLRRRGGDTMTIELHGGTTVTLVVSRGSPLELSGYPKDQAWLAAVGQAFRDGPDLLAEAAAKAAKALDAQCR